MHLLQRLLLAVGALVVLLGAAPATAQWAWRDASGRMVFSDQAPPKSVPARNILRQPEVRPAPIPAAPMQAAEEAPDAAKEAAAEAPRPAPRPAAPPTLAEREIASRKRQQEQAEAEKKAARDEARKTQLAENCERLRNYQRALADGVRMGRVNADGEQVVFDDAARAAEAERIRAELERYCR